MEKVEIKWVPLKVDFFPNCPWFYFLFFKRQKERDKKKKDNLVILDSNIFHSFNFTSNIKQRKVNCNFCPPSLPNKLEEKSFPLYHIPLFSLLLFPFPLFSFLSTKKNVYVWSWCPLALSMDKCALVFPFYYKNDGTSQLLDKSNLLNIKIDIFCQILDLQDDRYITI